MTTTAKKTTAKKSTKASLKPSANKTNGKRKAKKEAPSFKEQSDRFEKLVDELPEKALNKKMAEKIELWRDRLNEGGRLVEVEAHEETVGDRTIEHRAYFYVTVPSN